MSLIQHFEYYLGPIDKGWKERNCDESLQILSFLDCPEESVSTYLSLGMSDNVLKINESKSVRQELVFSAYTHTSSSLVVSFLMSMCEAILQRGRAVLRGEVIPLSFELAKKIGFEYAYCAIPVFFEDNFDSYDKTSPPTVMVWLLPIYKSEAEFIKEKGWETFEDLLEEKDPDLCSLGREPVV